MHLVTACLVVIPLTVPAVHGAVVGASLLGKNKIKVRLCVNKLEVLRQLDEVDGLTQWK